MNIIEANTWIGNWVWGLPLIVLTVVLHVCGLAAIGERVVFDLSQALKQGSFMRRFILVMSVTALAVTALHGFEAVIWAGAYRFLGALTENKVAMLYSLGALTSYGHADIFLRQDWQLMGTLEALNGVLLFGLTTAFLFAMIQRVWPLGIGITQA